MISFDKKAGRVGVQVDGVEKPLALKPVNLEPLGAPNADMEVDE